MKKTTALLLIIIIILLMSVAYAEDLGIQIIGGPDTNDSVPLSLDDMIIGETYKIDGYGTITLTNFSFIDYFAQFTKDSKRTINKKSNVAFFGGYPDLVWVGERSFYYGNNSSDVCSWVDSGNEAEFAWLEVDIVNAQKKPVKYLEETEIQVVFDDDYIFKGWIRQANFDYNNFVRRENSSVAGPGATYAVLHPTNEESINMMYTGHFVWGCTLPNNVVESKAPLRIEIKLGNNDLTYVIRK